MDRQLLLSLAKNDFKAKYAGSAFGAVWAFINPIITILIYWFVFQVAFSNGPVEGMPYVLWLVSGIVPWFFFSEAWGGATGALADYSYLVKKVIFPVEKLPLIRILSALFVHFFFVLLIFIIYFAYGYSPALIHLQVFYYIAATFLLVYGIGRITAVLMVFLKDVNNVVGVFVQFGFWLTPIFWDISAIPQNIVWLFKINPVYYFVQGFRDTFIFDVWFWQHPAQTVYFWVLTAALLLLSNVLFKRLRPHLADLL